MAVVRLRTFVSRLPNGSYVVQTRKDGQLVALPESQANISAAFNEVRDQQAAQLAGAVVQELVVTTEATTP